MNVYLLSLLIYGGLIALILLILGYLWIQHNFGKTPPMWTWGEKPSSSIIVRYWKRIESPVKIQYKILNFAGNWQESYDIFNREYLSPTDHVPVKNCTRHIFRLNGLAPACVYRYRIVDGDNPKKIIYSNKRCRFQTQSPTNKEFKFVICGDSQQSETLAPLETYMWHKIRREHPDFILFLGDHVHSYQNTKLWSAFFRMMRKIFPQIPFYATVGNHCGGKDGGKTAAYTYLMAPFQSWNYTWSIGTIFFISLNSLSILSQDPNQRNALKQFFLESIKLKPENARFVVVYTHVPWIGPPYRSDGMVSEYETYLKTEWEPLFREQRVDLVFSGHKHAYIREGNYFVSASIHGVRKYPERHESDIVVVNSHHYLVVQADEKGIKITAKRWDNKILDYYEVKKP